MEHSPVVSADKECAARSEMLALCPNGSVAGMDTLGLVSIRDAKAYIRAKSPIRRRCMLEFSCSSTKPPVVSKETSWYHCCLIADGQLPVSAGKTSPPAGRPVQRRPAAHSVCHANRVIASGMRQRWCASGSLVGVGGTLSMGQRRKGVPYHPLLPSQPACWERASGGDTLTHS